MCGLAHYFESEGLSTVLVGFIREHMEALRPPRSLFLDFPMGRGMGKPNNPGFQKKVIRAAFELLNQDGGPIIEDFPEVIPVSRGRMGYALPPELVLNVQDIGNPELILVEVRAEIEALRPDYETAVEARIFLFNFYFHPARNSGGSYTAKQDHLFSVLHAYACRDDHQSCLQNSKQLLPQFLQQQPFH